MPASTFEPIAATLKHAFSTVKAKTQGGGGGGASHSNGHASSSAALEHSIGANSKKSLLSLIQFDGAVKHVGSSNSSTTSGHGPTKKNGGGGAAYVFLNPMSKQNGSGAAARTDANGAVAGGSNGSVPQNPAAPPKPKVR